MNKKTLTIGILGLGTVGSGVVDILIKNKAKFYNNYNTEIIIKIIAVRNKNLKRSCKGDFILTDNAYDVINSDVDLILELIGGTTIAKDLVMGALNSNKHVITANKALIANYGNELLQIASNNNVKLLFEAAVAGGIPILKVLQQGLSANNITMIAGIINGTTNFILTEMRNNGRNFADVLVEAQKLGYAESDPTFDIEGIDAAHKISILSAIAFGTEFNFTHVGHAGISSIDSEDVDFADEFGYNIKHLALTKMIDNTIYMGVEPTLIKKNTLLAKVDGVMNAVFVRSDALGDSLYYGAGAGGSATASSVVADIIDIINNTCVNNFFSKTPLTSINICQKDAINMQHSVLRKCTYPKTTSSSLLNAPKQHTIQTRSPAR